MKIAAIFFGDKVDIDGDRAIVGAFGEDEADGLTSGAAYIFNVTTGELIHTLDNPNAYGTTDGDWFASSVSISGSYAIVGAHREDTPTTNSGKAYIFNINTGTLVQTLDNPNPYDTEFEDRFGLAVGIIGDYAIVGGSNEDEVDGSDSGKVYIYRAELPV